MACSQLWNNQIEFDVSNISHVKLNIILAKLLILRYCSENDDDMQPIPSMPDVFRFGLNRLREHLNILVPKGLKSILLFGVTENLAKVII